MAGRVLKRRRLVNRGRRRMSNKQIRYFGTKRQRAALKNRHRRRNAAPKRRTYRRRSTTVRRNRTYNRGHRRRRNQTGIVSQAEHAIRSVERAAEDAIDEVAGVTHVSNRGRRRRNVGEILTIVPGNPGRRRRRSKMAATHRRRRNRRRNRVSNRSYRRRNRRRLSARRNYGHRRRTRRNRNPRVVVRYRNRRRSNRGHRRRNQGIGGWLGGDAGAVIGVLGGAAVTKILTGFLPSNLTTGWPGYITTGIVAVVTGQVAGRMTGNRRLGNMMTVGGLVIVGLQIANDFFPQLQLPFTYSGGATSSAAAGTSGMGLITSSNFFVPQVNLPGSMASFVAPAAIPAPVVVPATTLKGFGATGTSTMNSGLRRVGRLR